MVTWKSPGLWISLTVGGIVVGALGVIFIVLDLEEADQLASVVGVFIALAGLGISVYGVVLARRSEASSADSSPASSPPSDTDAVTARGERPVTIRNNSEVIRTGDAGHTTTTGAGDTSNTIKGGTFHAPVIMARDITGPPAAQPLLPPASSSDGPDVPEQPR